MYFNKYKMNLLINFFTLLSILSCQQNKDKILEKEDYSVNYPSSLELDISGQNGTTFILKTQKENEKDTFIENINLVITNIGETTLYKIKNKSIKDVGSIGEIIEDKDLIINGKDCFRLVFKVPQNGIDFTVIQHYFVENQKAYLLTFTSETAKLKKYFNEIDNVLSSFKIK